MVSETQGRTRGKGTAAIWFFGALGGILWGFDTGVISGALLYIPDDIPLSPLQQGFVVSGLLVGAMLGAGLSGRLADSLGRRRLIFAGGVVFVVGTLGAALGVSALMLVAFRFVMGIGVGIISVVVPMYLSELAPKEIRGRLTSLMQLLVTTGIFLAYVIDFVFSASHGWRWMIGIGVIPAVVLAIGIYTQPESPRWLAAHKHGGEADARSVLARLRGSECAADEELAEIQESVAAEARQTERLRLRSLLGPRLRPIFVVGMLLVFFQNFVGINTIIYYAPTLLNNVGFGTSGAILANVGIGAVNMVMTLPGMYLIDRAGRRPLLLYGRAGHVRRDGAPDRHQPRRPRAGHAAAEPHPRRDHRLHRVVLDLVGARAVGPAARALPAPGARRRGQRLRHVQLAVQHGGGAGLPVAARRLRRRVELPVLRPDDLPRLRVREAAAARDEGPQPRGDRAGAHRRTGGRVDDLSPVPVPAGHRVG